LTDCAGQNEVLSLRRQRRSVRADYEIAGSARSVDAAGRIGSGYVEEIGGDGTGGRRATSQCVPRKRRQESRRVAAVAKRAALLVWRLSDQKRSQQAFGRVSRGATGAEAEAASQGYRRCS
jgi:hypothetical protein